MIETWQEAWTQKEKPRSAKEIFDLLQASSLPRFKPEVRPELLAKGNRPEDVDLAMQMMACIGIVDAVVFPGESILLSFTQAQNLSNPDCFAAYCSPRENPVETYDVWPTNLFQGTEKVLGFERLILEGCPFKGDPQAPLVSREEFLLGVAIHEVRHRLQYHEKVELFSVDDVDNFKPPLRKCAIWIKELMFASMEVERENANRESVITYCQEPSEFDARIVECFSRAALHQNISLEGFFALPLLSPVAYR